MVWERSGNDTQSVRGQTPLFGSWSRCAITAVVVTGLSSAVAALLLAIVILGYGAVDSTVALKAAHEATVSGVLHRPAWLPLKQGQAVPVYAPNDCLILDMLVIPPRDGRMKAAVSPQTPVTSAQMQQLDARLPAAPQCQGLGQLINSIGGGTPGPEVAYYHRYIHAYRVAMAAMLQVASFNTASFILLATTVLALAYLLVRSAWDALHGDVRGIFYGALALTLLLFSGIGVFDWSFSFAPTDILTYLFLIATYHGLFTKAPAWLFSVVLCAFGGLIADFEFLTGAIPGFISAFFLAAAMEAPRLGDDLRRTVIRGLSCFCLTVILSFAFKVLLVSLMWGPEAYADFNHQLMTRMGTAVTLSPREAEMLSPYGITEQSLAGSRLLATAYAFIKLVYFAYMLAFGSELLGIAVLALGLISGLAATWAMLRYGGGGALGAAGTWLGLAAILVAPAWYVIMPNHSIEHGFFMVRLLSWPLAASLVMVAARSLGGMKIHTRTA